MTSVAVIGAGFSGLAAATSLARKGFDVTLFEKNATPGGRARRFTSHGFTFDMGPSWYWMPDVFERYFNQFGKTTGDYYELVRLDPSYRIYFGKDDFLDIPAKIDDLFRLFEKLQPGSSRNLRRFLHEGKQKYELGMQQLVREPGLSLFKLIDPELFKNLHRLHLFRTVASHIRKFFKEPRLIRLLEFPVLFLGATPQKIPALYTLMNYADMVLGTWHPRGGMYTVVEAMVSLAREYGVTLRFNSEVRELKIRAGRITGIVVHDQLHAFDYVVAGADYHHVEQQLLPPEFRQHSPSYWNSRVLTPSCLIFFTGVGQQMHHLLHHTLFFDQDFTLHANELYAVPRWPTAPLFYVNAPSRTDPGMAPEGSENLFILIPVAPGLADEDSIREKYFDTIMERIAMITGENPATHIAFKRSYAIRDFISDYNAFRGNAYGLACTLSQTLPFRPHMMSRKVSNLFFTGHFTIPGPGIPPALISGQWVADVLEKRHLAFTRKRLMA